MTMDTRDNPCGLEGFAFLEFSGPNRRPIQKQFEDMGFNLVASHLDDAITLYQQHDIQFIINATIDSQAFEHAKAHGPGACAMGFKVQNAKAAFEVATSRGAKAFKDDASIPHRLPAIEGIGGSVIYFVDDDHLPFAHCLGTFKELTSHANAGLQSIDHLTHNVHQGNMDKWADFYSSIFNFHQIRFFDITGQKTGLVSRALSSPCGQIKIPLNESKDPKSQIEEFLHEYHGEGIQHIALSTNNIYHSVKTLKKHGVQFLDVPDTYYDMCHQRVPWHQEPLKQLQDLRILIDGEKKPDAGLLLQIFTENVFGPVFFEIIQRKGNEGFGEGNFKALFEAIERDQMRRGTL